MQLVGIDCKHQAVLATSAKRHSSTAVITAHQARVWLCVDLRNNGIVHHHCRPGKTYTEDLLAWCLHEHIGQLQISQSTDLCLPAEGWALQPKHWLSLTLLLATFLAYDGILPLKFLNHVSVLRWNTYPVHLPYNNIHTLLNIRLLSFLSIIQIWWGVWVPKVASLKE